VKLLLAAALVLILSSLALAATENQQLGPYMVSFDMNTPMQYQVQVQEPIETPYSTIYSMRIATDDTTGASIGITEYKNKTDATLDVAKQLTAMGMALRGLNVTSVNDQTIDGREGFLIAGEAAAEATNVPQGATLYLAGYWLDSVDCECGPVSVGTVNVGISSSYPEDVTQNLVNTIMISAGQAPVQTQAGQMAVQPGQMAQPQMNQDMPPADMSQPSPQ
jgi:hypothetical protein